MIYGIGTDIVEVDRIAAKIAKGKGFLDLVFTPHEIAYCEQQAGSAAAESYAARFAAKEAFLKAMGTGWGHGAINFNQIEVRNTVLGKPELFLLGEAAAHYAQLNIQKIHLSLSHIRTAAVAMVIIEV